MRQFKYANDDSIERRFVVRRECDEAMASKKGYLPCDHKCKLCLACIEILESGDRQHVSSRRRTV